MSKHYLLNITISLKSKISLEEEVILNYMINNVGNIDHIRNKLTFFDSDEKRESFAAGYKNSKFTHGEYISVFWKNELMKNSSSVQLILPSIKDIQGWYQSLKFVNWLCPLVKADGLIGFIVDEGNLEAHSFLYTFDGILHFSDEKNTFEITSFLTGNIRKINVNTEV
jgi:hypothetical protein